MILVDYYCPACRVSLEQFATQPFPSSVPCPDCGSTTRRRYTGARLVGRATPPASGSTACVDNPDVPGLCHVGPDAKRTLIARHRGDDVTLAVEQARQQARFEQMGAPRAERVGHTHDAAANRTGGDS